MFGEDRVIERGSFRVVYSSLKTNLLLLALRGIATIRAGTTHAVGQVKDTVKTQPGRDTGYENALTYGLVDGLMYATAHNGEDAILLYERAQPAINASVQRVRRLANRWTGGSAPAGSRRTGFVLL